MQYAPKDKQTKALCEDPQSVCDAAYGLSIGRGAFTWAAGEWTTVTQTVTLNTPGRQDGAFTLDVNGERRIARSDVFYRDDISGSDDTKKNAKTTTRKVKTTLTTKRHSKTATSTTTTSKANDGDILGPILDGLLGSLRRRQQKVFKAETAMSMRELSQESLVFPSPTAGPTTAAPTPTHESIDLDGTVSAERVTETEVNFVGIFFR